jgi:hypothetical protein
MFCPVGSITRGLCLPAYQANSYQRPRVFRTPVVTGKRFADSRPVLMEVEGRSAVRGAQALETLYLSAITVAELRFDVASLPAGKRRDGLRESVEPEFFPCSPVACCHSTGPRRRPTQI